MSSLATTFVPTPLLQYAGENKEMTDKNMLSEKDFSVEFNNWFNKYESEIKKEYESHPLIMAEFSLKEFALELRAEME